MRRFTGAAAIAVLAAMLLSQAVAVPASARGTVQCRTYDGCEAEGKSHYGYKQAASNEYWRMYGGHNCTNYAAYRLIQNGMHALRPWDGNGNANAWGHANADITDRTPTVGSIAWWDANDGVGSLGHVAYVQRVVSANRIVVSEDNWGGEFFWRVLDRGDPGWPTGFIHFKDRDVSSSFPAFRARALAQSVWTDASRRVAASATHLKPGSTAWVTTGWRNTGDESWTGMTLRAASADSPLGGAWSTPGVAATQTQATAVTGATLTLGFPVTIPAGVPDGTPYTQTFALTDASGAAVPGGSVTMTFTADSRDPLTATPSLGVGGIGKEGRVLSAVEGGSWAPVQPAVSYQWTRDGVPIAGATGADYTLTSRDVGRRVGLTSTTSAPGFLPAVRSAASPSTIRSKYAATLALKGRLKTDVQLVSANGVYKLVHGKKGNLALVNRFTKKTVWSSKAYAAKAYTRLRGDGKLVSYSASGRAVWKAAATKKAVRAVVTNSGKLVLYTKTGSVAWKTPAPRAG